MKKTPYRPAKPAKIDVGLLALALARIETLMPAYALFAELCQWDERGVLRTVVDTLWQRAEQAPVTVNIDAMIEKVEMVTPAPEDFDNYGVWPALDASVAVMLVLEWCAEHGDGLLAQLDMLITAGIERHLEVTETVGEGTLFDDYQDFCAAVEGILARDGAVDVAIKALRSFIGDTGVSHIGLQLN